MARDPCQQPDMVQEARKHRFRTKIKYVEFLPESAAKGFFQRKAAIYADDLKMMWKNCPAT